jgi:hypothetical protein
MLLVVSGYYTEFGRVGKLSGDKKAEKLTKVLCYVQCICIFDMCNDVYI